MPHFRIPQPKSIVHNPCTSEKEQNNTCRSPELEDAPDCTMGLRHGLFVVQTHTLNSVGY